MNREVLELADLARAAGWVVERTQGRHMRFVPPGGKGRIVVASGTPGDGARAIRNLRADLRREGLKVP